MDGTKKTQDGGADNPSPQTSDDAKGTSQVKDEAKAKSDELARLGREKKTAEESKELETLRAEVSKLRDENLKIAAERLGKSLEDVKTAGITTAEQLNSMASFFGGAKPTSKSTFEKPPDSGKNSGSGSNRLTQMSGKEILEIRKKNNNMTVSELIAAGIAKP